MCVYPIRPRLFGHLRTLVRPVEGKSAALMSVDYSDAGSDARGCSGSRKPIDRPPVMQTHATVLLITRPRIVLTGVLTAYLIGSFAGLAVYPRVGEDEPWIAAAPYKLATEGILGSDLFAGFAGMERHHYQHMPVYPVLEAGVFKAFGVGVVQMRLLSVLFGFSLLIVVFTVGRLIADERVGLIAVLLLVGLRVADTDEATGILLLDRARINRYDVAVPVFGLLAFCAFVTAERGRPRAYVVAGLLSGLSSLSHLYGGFWLVTFVFLIVTRRGLRTASDGSFWLMVLGFMAAWVPWILFISTGWTDYLGQMRTVADRFDLFSMRFYVGNVLFADGPISVVWLRNTIQRLPASRIGTWTVLVGLPAAVGAIVWHTSSREPARMLAVASMVQLVLFVVLLQVKTISYMIALWPLGALLLAWVGTRIWDGRFLSGRVAVALLAAGIAIEGGARIAHARTIAQRMTSYDWYTSEVARCIPPGSLVLGLQHYWLGLRQFPYRTWLLPLAQTNARFTDSPIPLDEALERIDPDVILIDRYIAEMFAGSATPDALLNRLSVEFDAFAARRRLSPACVIRDRTYGLMQVYHVP